MADTCRFVHSNHVQDVVGYMATCLGIGYGLQQHWAETVQVP